MKKVFTLVFLVCSFWSIAQVDNQVTVRDDAFSNVLKYRNIGPFRGGRSVAACGVIGDPLTYYMGTTGGGLWKTEDAGQLWKNISDKYFKTGSVGAVAVAKSDANIVYCGMGEHAVRGVMTHHGDGVYKSINAGKTWQHIGLKGTQHISRIVIHPNNPNIVYVAAQGALYSRSTERGIYKSTNGGETWQRILYVDDRTGGVELSMDNNYPNVLYAAMWEHQRLPWKIISGGAGSGLYKSVDGGANWSKIHNGLPEEKGKMAVSVCSSNSNKVYALVESDSNEEKGGLFVSENAGESFTRVSKDHRLVQRAWYYTEVFTDPENEDMVYVLSAPALRSRDGGKTWERLTGTHGDFHDLWINPDNPKNLCIANDGGAAISFNRGKTWSRQDNMPTAQIYRISVDNAFPYNIYGGQQDNSSIRIAHRNFGNNIDKESWEASAGGESAFLAFDPNNPRYVMGGSYLGTIEIWDHESNSGTKVMAAPIQYLGRAASDMKYRYNWNAPIIWSQHEPGTFYHGAQYLLRTRDMGKTWEEASPDLTRNDKKKQIKGGGPYTVEAVGAENYGTISYIMESPHEAGHIWVASDDGLLHLTKDSGQNWENVTPKGLQECLINSIEVSPLDPATVYIATTRYKFNDHRPGLYKTNNYGKTWTAINTGIPTNAFTRVVRADSKQKGLLYAGTELGMFISRNDGVSWEPFQLNLPITPITDLMVKHDDLIVATSGRSFWVLDDLGVVRQYNTSNSDDFKLFTPDPAMLTSGSSPLNYTNPHFLGSNSFTGVNPANGIVIYYHLPKSTIKEPLTLTIKDTNGKIVRTYTSKRDTTFVSYAGGPSAATVLPSNAGLNRIVWDMRHSTMTGAPRVYIEGSFKGHKVVPGTYFLSLTQGETNLKTTVEVLPNPLYEITQETYLAYDKQMDSMEKDLDEMHKMVNSLLKLRNRAAAVIGQLPNTAEHSDLKKEGKILLQKIKVWDEDMVQRKSQAYDDVENFPNKFTAEYLYLINQTESDIPRINQPNLDRYKELSEQWKILKQRGEELINKDIPAYNQRLWEAGVGAIWER